jgi:hypothetical protein
LLASDALIDGLGTDRATATQAHEQGPTQDVLHGQQLSCLNVQFNKSKLRDLTCKVRKQKAQAVRLGLSACFDWGG